MDAKTDTDRQTDDREVLSTCHSAYTMQVTRKYVFQEKDLSLPPQIFFAKSGAATLLNKADTKLETVCTK